jgi:hypothetical protein
VYEPALKLDAILLFPVLAFVLHVYVFVLLGEVAIEIEPFELPQVGCVIVGIKLNPIVLHVPPLQFAFTPPVIWLIDAV